MTQLYLSPQVEDHFVEYDMAAVLATPADGSAHDLRRRVMEDYVGEKVILLRNCRVDYDQEFINTVRFPATWGYKKFNVAALEHDIPLRKSADKQAVCRDVCGGDKGKYRKLESEIRSINAGIRRIIDGLLAGYAITDKSVVWRHTETRLENLHFDVDQDSENIESVRLYLNMDDVPRIWHTTHPLSLLMQQYFHELDLAAFAGEPLERLLQTLTLRLFGSWLSRGRERFPHHVVMFEPGDFWLSDGRTVPHQVVYGRRTVSTFYRLDKERLPPWHPALSARVRRWIEELRTKDDAVGRMDENIYPSPYGPGGPAIAANTPKPSLKTDWEKVVRDSLRPTLVRL